jgi:hypothetical protein
MSTVISSHRARSTGTQVDVIDNRDGGFDTSAEENPWYTVCVPHSGVCSHMTRQLALDWASCPNVWCPVCQGTDPEED